MVKLLLHVCCAPCLLGTLYRLREYNYEIVPYFFNPNIFPIEEFLLRLKEVKRIAKIFNLNLIYNDDYLLHQEFLSIIKKDMKNRCIKCFEYRLLNSAKKCKELNIKYFTTTLTVGPTKKAELINKIGEKIASKFNLIFLKEDFKKKNGWNESVRLSRLYNVYRQNYCGCEYSLKERFAKD